MTVATTVSRRVVDGNGVSMTFSTNFEFFGPADLRVTYVQRNSSLEVISSTVLALTTDYTVTGGADTSSPLSNPSGNTGQVTLNSIVPGSNDQIILERVLPATQDLDLVPNALLPGPALERAYDKLTYLVQQALTVATDTINRTIRVPVGDSLSDLPTQRAGKFVTFNAAGDVALGVPEAETTQRVFDTRSAVEGATIESAVNAIVTGGYLNSEDGGGGTYARVAGEPTHEGKVQSADGAWWELVHPIGPKQFGAKADGFTDDRAAIQNAIEMLKAVRSDTAARVLDLGNESYVIDDTVVLEGTAANNREFNVQLANGELKASSTFPLAEPLLEVSSFAWASGAHNVRFECDFRACGPLSVGGPGGAFHTFFDHCEVRRVYRADTSLGYGMQIGTFKISTSGLSGSFNRGDTITGGTSGATGQLLRVHNTDDLLLLTVEGSFQNSETVTATSGGTATVTNWSSLGSSQAKIERCFISGLQNGDPDFFTLELDLATGIRVFTADAKVSRNIVSRCEPSVDVFGFQCLFEGNHTFPIPGVAQTSTLWRTNYRVSFGGNVFIGNYVDNGSIDFVGGLAAQAIVWGNLFTKNRDDISANRAPIRLIADKVNDRVDNGATYGAHTYGGNGFTQFDRAIEYAEPGSNTWAEKLDAAQQDEYATIRRDQSIEARIDNGAFVKRLVSRGTSAILSFSDAGTTIGDKPSFGSNGDDAVVRHHTLTTKFNDVGVQLPQQGSGNLTGSSPTVTAPAGTIVYVPNGSAGRPIAISDGSTWFYADGTAV